MEDRNWINEIVDQAQQEVKTWPKWMQRSELRNTVKLSDTEFQHLLDLLRRFSDTDLDQFDHWKLTTNAGDIFVDIGRKPLHDHYRSIN